MESTTAICPFCAKEVPANVKRCPYCLRDAPDISDNDDEAYELPIETPEVPAEWRNGAVYTLEFPARCPHCRELIRTLRVFRLKRTTANFTSTLPRNGRIIACPECERILTAELSTL